MCAMRSIHSLARIGGLTQPRDASNPEDAKKEKDRPNAKKGKEKAKGTIRHPSSSFEAGALTARPAASLL